MDQLMIFLQDRDVRKDENISYWNENIVLILDK